MRDIAILREHERAGRRFAESLTAGVSKTTPGVGAAGNDPTGVAIRGIGVGCDHLAEEERSQTMERHQTHYFLAVCA